MVEDAFLYRMNETSQSDRKKNNKEWITQSFSQLNQN